LTFDSFSIIIIPNIDKGCQEEILLKGEYDMPWRLIKGSAFYPSIPKIAACRNIV